MVKGSELAPASAQILADLLPKYLDPEAYAFVNGAVPETTHLLDLRWDHILFTGSGKTGRIVATAASKHVTPVTLELGGKSPVVIDGDFDLEVAARRVLYGKLQNSGQASSSRCLLNLILLGRRIVVVRLSGSRICPSRQA